MREKKTLLPTLGLPIRSILFSPIGLPSSPTSDGKTKSKLFSLHLNHDPTRHPEANGNLGSAYLKGNRAPHKHPAYLGYPSSRPDAQGMEAIDEAIAMPTTPMVTMPLQYLDHGSRLAGLHLAHRYLPHFFHGAPFKE
ncbi:hypothetical protein ES703_108354 [subsurface metagenome]